MLTSAMAKQPETRTPKPETVSELKYNIKTLLLELPRKITLKEVARSVGSTYGTLNAHCNIKQGSAQRIDADTLHNLSVYLTGKLNRPVTMEDLINKTDLQKLKSL